MKWRTLHTSSDRTRARTSKSGRGQHHERRLPATSQQWFAIIEVMAWKWPHTTNSALQHPGLSSLRGARIRRGMAATAERIFPMPATSALVSTRWLAVFKSQTVLVCPLNDHFRRLTRRRPAPRSILPGVYTGLRNHACRSVSIRQASLGLQLIGRRFDESGLFAAADGAKHAFGPADSVEKDLPQRAQDHGEKARAGRFQNGAAPPRSLWVHQ